MDNALDLPLTPTPLQNCQLRGISQGRELGPGKNLLHTARVSFLTSITPSHLGGRQMASLDPFKQ